MPAKYVSKLLCAFLLCALLTGLSAEMRAGDGAQAASSTIYKVVPNKLNIRSGASVNSYILAQLKQGTLVKKLRSKNGWWYVQLKNGKEGYVDPKFLSEYGTDTDTDNYATGKLYFINSVNKVKVRSGASSSSKVKGKIRGGTVVYLHGTSGSYGYIEVYNNGNRGYVPLSLLIKY